MLGTMDWLSQAGVPSAASVIPAMILIAPAHAPSPALLDGYQQKLDAGDLPFGIPDSLYDLADPTSSVRAEALGAFADLSRAGIALHVIFWPGDIFTEYHTQFLAGLTEYQICTDRKLAHPMHAPREHLHLRDDPETTDQLTAILRDYASPVSSNGGGQEDG